MKWGFDQTLTAILLAAITPAGCKRKSPTNLFHRACLSGSFIFFVYFPSSKRSNSLGFNVLVSLSGGQKLICVWEKKKGKKSVNEIWCFIHISGD